MAGTKQQGPELVEESTSDNKLSGTGKCEDEQGEAMLIKHRDFLLDFVDSEFGLLDNLMRGDTLSWNEYEKLIKTNISRKRNKKLLEVICKKKRYSSFIKALKENQQSHISNYLIADGEHTEIFGDEWPLSSDKLSILTQNYHVLVELIDTSELLYLLFSNGVVTNQQREHITSKKTSHKRSRALIEILRRGSLRNYRATVNCLRLSYQDHVAEILEKGGVVAQIDISVSGPQEDDVVNRINKELRNYSPTERNEILRKLVDLNFIGAAESHSIALYFRCCNLFEIDRLKKMVEGKQLKRIVEAVIVHLFGFTCKFGVEIKSKLLQKFHLRQSEFARCGKCLKDLDNIKASSCGSIHSTCILSTELTNLPHEILDNILQKSYVYKSFHRPHREVVVQLASVNFCFFQRIMKRIFKVSTMRKFIEIYGKHMKIALFCRSNRDYIKRFIQQTRFMSVIKSADCLSDVQIAIVNRHKHRHAKRNQKLFRGDVAVELLGMLRHSDEREQWSVIHCLRPIQGKHFERMGGKEGGLLKINVKQENAQKDRFLLLKLNELIDNESSTSDAVAQMRNKLTENGLKIVGASMDRDFVCWIWVRSENVMKQFQQLGVEIKSMDVFTELLRSLTDDDLIRKFNVDHESLQKTKVPLSIYSTFASKLVIKSDASQVRGITKLRNEIYVLFSSSEIYVFENRNQFRYKRVMKIDKIHQPQHIGSNEKENCLYITDPSTRPCVWKIKEEIHENRQKKHQVIRWLEIGKKFRPVILSVSRDGHLLMASRLYSDLKIYGSDAELLLSVQLPTGIYRLQHAVETWDGNIIILHCSWTEMIPNQNVGSFEWGVSELSRDGKTIVHRFIPKDDVQDLRYPEYISICSGDRVIVADTGNNRVVLLDSDLKWNRILIQNKKGRSGKIRVDQIWAPAVLFYDDETKCLYVEGKAKDGEQVVNLYTLF